MPPKPADLAPAVAAVWDEIAEHIALTRVTVADTIALYHQTGSKPVIRGAGGIVVNPIVVAVERARQAMASAAQEIGATPCTDPPSGSRSPPPTRSRRSSWPASRRARRRADGDRIDPRPGRFGRIRGIGRLFRTRASRRRGLGKGVWSMDATVED